MNALLLVALFAVADMPVVLESSGIEVRAIAPNDPSCRVRGAFHTDWSRFLVSSLRTTDGFRTPDDARMVRRIHGRPAVSNRYRREPLTIHEIYVDLSDLQPDTGVVWTLEQGPEKSDCQNQFLAMIGSAAIARAEAAAAGTP